MLRVAESSGVPALRECGISLRPALRKNFWSLERVQVLFKTQTMVSAHSWSFWSDVCLNWCLVEKLFWAKTTSCVRSGVLPRVPVLEFCFEHTWFKLPHGIVKLGFEPTQPDAFARNDVLKPSWSQPTCSIFIFFADFGTCCSAKTFVYFDWSPTWHFKAIALTYFAKLKLRQA